MAPTRTDKPDKPDKSAGGARLRVIQTRSAIGTKPKHRGTLRALGLRTGFTHMEWFRRPDGSVAVSEVAARPNGMVCVSSRQRSGSPNLSCATLRIKVT